MIKDKRNTVLGIIVIILLISGVFVENVYYDLFISISYILWAILLLFPRKQKLTIDLVFNFLKNDLSGVKNLQWQVEDSKMYYTCNPELIKKLDKIVKDFDNEKIS